MEWEGTAERVACHPPYILLFDSRFIEIRHIETGRLVQVISGNDMRCVWDGRSTTSTDSITPVDDDWGGVSQESKIHGVMNAELTQLGQLDDAVRQHVFMLIPVIPLGP